MDKGANEHLPAAELAKLAEVVRQRGALVPKADDVHPHLAACANCRDQFERHVLLDRQLAKLGSSEPALHQADCPSPALWREIAGGATPADQALLHIHHASRCDHCGPLLRAAVAELSNLSQTTTETERERIATLASARPEWQRKMAERISGTPGSHVESTTRWRRWITVPRVAMAGAALLALVAVGSRMAVRQNPAADAGRLLARAYTEQRTLELRFAGAAYAPLRVQRGPEASFADRAPSLLKAEAVIASQLPSHPSDPVWLQAKARADLLEGKYDAAVESLRRALELEPHSPALLIDLGTAYFQRAQQEGHEDDLGAAFESLSQALTQRPEDPIAFFNRAIVSEHQFLYRRALDDWEHFLRVDPRSEWADEARAHADAVRAKLQKHDQSHAVPLLSPAQVAAAANNPNLGAEIDQRVEEYLHEAVRSWLPKAYPATSSADPQTGQALFFLAELANRQHGDRWLSDLLSGSSSPHFRQAVAALSRAIQANDAGEYDTSRAQAAFAHRLFLASENTAGALRAQFEQAFSRQLLRRSEECRQEATAALADSEKYPYPWLHIQLGLEKGVCSSLMGDLGTDEKAAQRAMERAQRASYGALFLRALGFVAEDRSDVGDRNAAAKLLSTGLARYWTGQFPAMRAYNLYVFVTYTAEAVGRPNLQMALWSQAVALISSDQDLLLCAEAHSELARAASTAGQSRLAEQQYAEAARLYVLAPQSEAVRSYRIENEIHAAQVESRQGQFDAAIARLTRIQSEIRQLSNNYLAQIFYSTLGELQLRRRHEAEAEQALRPALALAEQNLVSLNSEAERMSWSKDAAPVYLAMAESQLLQGLTQESLETFERYLGASQRAGTHSVEGRRENSRPGSPGPSWLASRLPLLSKETVVAYGALPDGLAIWTCDDRGVNAQWIPEPPRDAEDLAARFYDLASDPKSELSAIRRDARDLYALLVAPVEARFAPGRTLVIETQGWPSRVPFEALLDSNGHYLVERAPIVYSLGQYSEAWMHSEVAISANMPALVVGSEAFLANRLIPIPDIVGEADAVSENFHHSRVLTGREATLSRVKKELPVAALFHFAGHALDTPGRSGLMLESGDASNAPVLLDAGMLRRLPLENMTLALLSACSTGSSGGGSLGFNSVTEGLLRAGVPHVVASRWAVDSEARSFVEGFYRDLLAGQPVADAVRLTSRRMLSNPRTAHPYYWSAFAAYGRP